MNEIVPIFLLSVQRSGSTLLQRMIASHPQVGTVSEPWILLPFMYGMRRDGVYAEYRHGMMVGGVEDFVAELPRGVESYREELRRMTLRLYRGVAGPDSTHFLDKTPRYALVVDELHATFPEAKYVVLWRNPLAVVASIIETWGGGTWNIDPAKIDVYDGLFRLVEARHRYGDSFHTLRYEDLVAQPAATLSALFRHLELPDPGPAADRFSDTELRGRMGDPVHRTGYTALSSEPLAKWRHTLNNPFRKAWSRRYLEIIGRDRLTIMGYELDELLRDLRDAPSSRRHLGRDLTAAARGLVHTSLETKILRDKLARLPSWHSVHRHG